MKLLGKTYRRVDKLLEGGDSEGEFGVTEDNQLAMSCPKI